MKYKVIGAANVLGHAPDETFDADLSDAQEARLIARGSIEVVGEESSAAGGSSGFTFQTSGTAGATDDDNNNTGEEAGEGTYST